MFGIALTLVQHLALGLVESRLFPMDPLLKFVQVLLNGIPSFYCVNNTAHLPVIFKFAENVLNPTVCVIDKDIKEYKSQIKAWGTPLVTSLHLDIESLTTTLGCIHLTNPLSTV
ncbi:hypothetical protein BTVI_78228 [Pitangus sulphuratus]|nr:hypothetical protein BTVI_78228 [Pitangus sulphuratus]